MYGDSQPPLPTLKIYAKRAEIKFVWYNINVILKNYIYSKYIKSSLGHWPRG
jgi:hypothetical protein